MKRSYQKPYFKSYEFQKEDVITTSGLMSADIEGGYAEWKSEWEELMEIQP